jgi:hypothetical protein
MDKALVAATAILLFQTSPCAQATTGFYKGKNITFIVGPRRFSSSNHGSNSDPIHLRCVERINDLGHSAAYIPAG